MYYISSYAMGKANVILQELLCWENSLVAYEQKHLCKSIHWSDEYIIIMLFSDSSTSDLTAVPKSEAFESP